MLPPFDPWLTSCVSADVAVASHARADALAGRRAQRLASLLGSAASGSALYRKLLAGRDPAHWRLADLPIARKAELMQQFDDWVTDPALRLDELHHFASDCSCIADAFCGRYVVWESSGSTGEPAMFAQDAKAMAVYDALEFWRGPALQRTTNPWSIPERIAFVGATGGHFASWVSMERLRRLNPAMASSLHGISFLQPARELVAELNALAPTVVATYPSVAVLLAEERQAGRFEAAPGALWTGGEDLSAATREYLQQALDCRVANSYGASEFLALASECRFGNLHLNSDWAILESVDEQGREVPAGEAGATALLTNLANHVQPLIRYDLGDRVTLHAESCECGSHHPVIEVQGRNDDSLQLGRPGDPMVRITPLAVSTVLEDDAGLFDFQLEQQGPCQLLLRTGLHGETADSSLQRARAVLSDFLAGQGAGGVHIHCRSGEVSRGRSGKVQRVVSMLEASAGVH
ncbi:phenylacetate--CoA ligase family protein [Variovorax sp. J2P1-59]|uniref:phenylacetate--CoA ligase family protein n=1 Tax=Variovorax flavidus TaxID=3053501 RepID=UPI0025789567|nr:phenylacetate--CoA ligase family protein [Variovorax sp. J2P1-59]MDM0073739.1 phenylacetate--CoA ligase family protein [Variovorax sp. J2P1-59]